MLDELRWLGLDWDEGPRSAARTRRTGSRSGCDALRRGGAPAARGRLRVRAFSSTEESRRGPAAGGGQDSGYDNHDRTSPTRRAPRSGPRAASRCCGSGCPTSRSSSTDLIRGEVSFEPANVPDFVLVRGRRLPALPAGQPGRRRADGDHPRAARRGPALVHAAADPAARGAARARRRRPGRAALRAPALRARRGQQEAVQARPAGEPGHYRERGYLPEGLLNYLALLGWSMRDDREMFTLAEMVEAFTSRVPATRRAST